MARPSKYSKARADKICSFLRNGSTRKCAALVGGIDYKTFLSWIETNSSFSTQVEEAEAQCEALMAAQVVKDGRKDYKAALQWLERRRKDDWKRTEGRDLGLDDTPTADLLARLFGGSRTESDPA